VTASAATRTDTSSGCWWDSWTSVVIQAAGRASGTNSRGTSRLPRLRNLTTQSEPGNLWAVHQGSKGPAVTSRTGSDWLYVVIQNKNCSRARYKRPSSAQIAETGRMLEMPQGPDRTGPGEHGGVAFVTRLMVEDVCCRHGDQARGRSQEWRRLPREPHLRLLDRAPGHAVVQRKMQTDEAEPQGDRLSGWAGVLRCECIDGLLVEKVRACPLDGVGGELQVVPPALPARRERRVGQTRIGCASVPTGRADCDRHPVMMARPTSTTPNTASAATSAHAAGRGLVPMRRGHYGVRHGSSRTVPRTVPTPHAWSQQVPR
jgi:hypothetical protein